MLDSPSPEPRAPAERTTRKIYLNGAVVGQDTPGANGATAASFRIGSTNNGEFFNGSIDDVAIYNHALSAAEVSSLAAGGSPNAGPSITNFTASPATAYEGGAVALSWTVNTANVTGAYSYEILRGAAVVNSGAAATGTFNTVAPDLAGAAQTLTWTLRAIETGGGNVTTSASASVLGDPGIPSATSQAGLTTAAGTPLAITLAGSDPNIGALSYVIVTPPAKGELNSPGDFLSMISSPDPKVGEAHTFTLVSGTGSEESALPWHSPGSRARRNPSAFAARMRRGFLWRLLSFSPSRRRREVWSSMKSTTTARTTRRGIPSSNSTTTA